MRTRSSVDWEKNGNTWWLECSCGTWFPVSEELARHAAAKVRCPKCEAEFKPIESARVCEP